MRWTKFSSFGIVVVSAFSTLASAAWNMSANNNVALYWGQNSFSAISNDTAKQQKDLLYYCKQPGVDVRFWAWDKNLVGLVADEG